MVAAAHQHAPRHKDEGPGRDEKDLVEDENEQQRFVVDIVVLRLEGLGEVVVVLALPDQVDQQAEVEPQESPLQDVPPVFLLVADAPSADGAEAEVEHVVEEVAATEAAACFGFEAEVGQQLRPHCVIEHHDRCHDCHGEHVAAAV